MPINMVTRETKMDKMNDLNKELVEALEHIRAIALLVSDKEWSEATTQYNIQLRSNDEEFIFSLDLAKDALIKVKGE